MSMFQPRTTTTPPMLTRRTTAPAPLSTTTIDKEADKHSGSRDGGSSIMLLSLLSGSIQSRIPNMPLLRRTKSGPVSSDPGKGRPHYHPWTRSVSGATTPISEVTDAETETVVASEEDDTVGALWIPSKRPDVLDEMAVRAGPSGSAIEWRCGRPGMELLISAVDESKNAGRSARYDAAFERRAYLDGLSYLLRGLPRDLDTSEVASLRKSLPAPLAEAVPSGKRNGQPGFQKFFHRQKHGGEPTLLQRGMKIAVANVILLVCMIWPYVLILLKQGAHYERKYKVSEQLLGRGIVLVNALGKRSAVVSQVIGKMGDGVVGQVVNGAVAWTVHGVASGISEGLEEGLSQTGGKWRI